MQKIIIDEGSAQIKACWIDSNNQVQEKIIQAAVIPGAKMIAVATEQNPSAWEIGSRKYTVNEKMSDRKATNVSRIYQFSESNRVLIHEMLRQIGMSGQNVEVLTTLPISLFYEDDQTNEENIQRKVDNTKGPIKHHGNIPPANILESSVYPESISAAFDYLYDWSGNLIHDVRRIMIVDIGGTTTDITILTGDYEIEKHTCLNEGVFGITKKVKTQLLKTTDFDEIDDYRMNQAINTGVFDGDDIVPILIDQSIETIEQIYTKMCEFSPDAKNLSAVFYVGGGSAFMGKKLKDLYGGNSVIADNPSMANARGILKCITAFGD